MERIDNSKFLLYIEPKVDQKSKEPVNDEITEIVERLLSNAIPGAAEYRGGNEFFPGSGFKGWHTTDCGEWSDNHDYLLPNGMITNSLCVFYLQYYRDTIPQSEMDKVMELVAWDKKN